MGHGGLVDLHGLEPTLESGVLLEVLAILIERGGTNGLEFSARQHRLEDRRRVDSALGGTGPDESVDLIDEQDDVAPGLYLLEDLLEALLEVTAIAAPSHQGSQIEGVELLVADGLRNSISGDHLCEALDDGRLAHARLADQDWVVLGAARQHLHDPFRLTLAANHWVKLLFTGGLGEVPSELVQHERTRCRVAAAATSGGTGFLLGLALTGTGVTREQLNDLLADPGQVGAQLHKNLSGHALALTDESQQDVLGADVVVAQLQGLAQREL